MFSFKARAYICGMKSIIKNGIEKISIKKFKKVNYILTRVIILKSNLLQCASVNCEAPK